MANKPTDSGSTKERPVQQSLFVSDEPDIPMKHVQCLVLLQSVDKDQPRVCGKFIMKTAPDFTAWFTFAPKTFSMPSLGKLDGNKKLNQGFKTALRQRIKKSLRELTEEYGPLSDVPQNEWLEVTVTETKFS